VEHREALAELLDDGRERIAEVPRRRVAEDARPRGVGREGGGGERLESVRTLVAMNKRRKPLVAL
jgi:hypothetical protein